ASTVSCSGGKWLVIWPVAVDYPVSAPLTFNGPFEQVMTGLFTLYQKAAVPLYAGVSRQQCVISVSDKPFPGGTP
ncbi:pilus assembly protein PilL, partial [Salmonella enterica]|nr:pilus assembly protein PilL [Salmonella enterica]